MQASFRCVGKTIILPLSINNQEKCQKQLPHIQFHFRNILSLSFKHFLSFRSLFLLFFVIPSILLACAAFSSAGNQMKLFTSQTELAISQIKYEICFIECWKSTKRRFCRISSMFRELEMGKSYETFSSFSWQSNINRYFLLSESFTLWHRWRSLWSIFEAFSLWMSHVICINHLQSSILLREKL